MRCYFNFVFLDLSCGESDVIPMYFMCCSVNWSVCLVCYVFHSETIRNIFGRGVILLLNVMEVFSVGGGTLLDRPGMVF